MKFSTKLILNFTIVFLLIVIEVVVPSVVQADSGDIRFRRYYKDSRRVPRAATAKKERIWPEGIIPFVIASNFSGEHQHLFLRAMRHWENYTCVSFVPRQAHHKHYITFTVDKCGCCSYVGRRGEGPQAISIGKNCDKFGIVVHELGHVVGFWHEHTRPDRDGYVDIFYKSIQTGQDYNFEKSKPEEVDSLDEPYDFSSIMHYARDTFSRGAFYDTILPKPNSGFRLEIGQRVQLSDGDIRQTKKLYKCAECGGTLMQESGNLAIQNAGMCTWHIISPQGHTIFLNITGSTLSSPSTICSKEEDNVITVRDGVSTSSPLLDRICGGSSHFRTIASSGNRILIQVKSTTPTPSLPFATYYAICGGPIYANEGVIHSPKYPESYPPNSDCQWTIHVDENSQVAIEFVYFHLEQHKECIYDRLILTEGSSKTLKKGGKEMSETFCGLIEKKIVVSKTNQVSLRFFSDNSVQKSGFELRFSKELNECATEKNICHHYCVNTVGGFKCACRVGYSLSSNGFSCDSTCGGYLKASNGSIASPNFPEMYPNSKTCIWEIEAPEGYHIFLNFTKFTVEGMKTECAYDYVKIGDSEKLCGEYDKPLLFTTPRNRVRIEFSSDSSVERDGFFANFIADFDECQNNNAGCEHTCQNRLGSYICTCNPGYILAEDKHNCKEGSCFFEVNAPAGDINSPNYPNDYPKGQNCSWHFVTTPGHRLMLTFSTFQVEEHAQCKYDSVSVFDGGDDSAQLAGVFCGLAPPPLLLSSSNELYLTFSSDASVSRRGFQAHYTSVCGGRLSAESTPGHIYSHATFSDSKYGKNQDCSWSVRAKSPGRGVRIQFSTFNIESEEGCQYDYIEIYDGSEATQESLVGRFCGDTAPEIITSTGKPPRAAIMADWMARLPDSVKKKPICLLCIPGSHDTGASWFNLRLGFAHDQSFLRYIRHLKFSFVKRIVKRWGLTQSMSLDEQLMVGIRFLDLRLELALDTRYSSRPVVTEDPNDETSKKSIFIVHGLFATDGLKLISQIVKFLEAHKEEVLILNVSHIYRMSNEDFKRYFLDSLEIQAAHSGIKLCSTHENVLTMSLELLVSKNSRIIVIGPTDNDIVPVCFRSSVLQNKWPNKNSTAEIIRFVQAEIHAPVAPCLRVMQGVVTPKLSDIIRNLRSSLRLTYSLTMRSLLKIWVRQLNEEEIGNLNILISDQVDNEFCRLVYFLNVNDSPDHQLDQYFSNPHLDEPESPFPYAAVEKILYPDRPPTSVVQRTVPPRTENIKEIQETNVEEEPVAQIVEVVPVVEQALRTLGEDEPEIHIEEISGDFDVESSSSQPRIPHLRSVMVQQIEMVLETDTSSEGTSTLPRSPVPPPKPKRASQRIPLIMEVIPLPDDPPTYTPSVSICRSSGTPVRIAPPVTEEELRLAALGEYPPYGSFRSQRLREESVRQEAVIIEREELEEEESADESTPLVSHEVDSMVEDLVINSTIDAMDNLADRFKKSL